MNKSNLSIQGFSKPLFLAWTLGVFVILFTVGVIYYYRHQQSRVQMSGDATMKLVRSCLQAQLWPDMTELKSFADIMNRLANEESQLITKNYFFEKNKTNYQLNLLPVTDEDRSFMQIELLSVTESGSHSVKTEQRLSFTDEDLQSWLEGVKAKNVEETRQYTLPEVSIQVIKDNDQPRKATITSNKSNSEVECESFERGFDEGFGSGLNCQCLNQ